MPGTNIKSALTSTVDAREIDENGLIITAMCTGAPPTTANTFVHGAMITRTDSGTGTAGVYQNTGSSAVPAWTLMDTALPGDSASKLIDTNSLTVVDVATVAATVNNMRFTGSATGLVTANAVSMNPVGTDAAVSLAMAPKGATGITTIGLSTGTGDIVLGSSSAAQSVKVGDGAGASTVNIAATGTAGNTVSIASTATADTKTDTVNIATGDSAGSGAKTVHIADGTPAATGVNTVTIGSLTNASVTTVQAGTGNLLLQAAGTGTVTVGKSDATGDVVVGKSSGAQSVKIGDGAGVATVNIANTSVAGAVVNVASAVTGAGITDTVTISGGNAAATGVKVVNIATGTPGTSGNNRVTLGGGATSKVSVAAVLTATMSANYIATEGGANNAITGSLVDAGGTAVPLAAGLKVVVKLAHTLQAGGNTFDFNAGGALAIKMHTNAASDLGTGYAATGVIELLYDGTVWLDMSQ